MAELKDSGTRREFNTGAVRDMAEGKGRCDLLPLDTASFLFGQTYGDIDVSAEICAALSLFQRTGDDLYLWLTIDHFIASDETPFSSYPDMFLEVAKHFEDGCRKYGENNWQKGIETKWYVDSAVRHYLKYLRGDTDEPHDRAFCWNIICAIWTCEHKPELNTYAVKDNKNETEVTE